MGRPRADAEGHIPPRELRLRHKDGLRWARLYFELEKNPDGSSRRGVGMVLGVSLGVFATYYAFLIAGQELAQRGTVPAAPGSRLSAKRPPSRF